MSESVPASAPDGPTGGGFGRVPASERSHAAHDPASADRYARERVLGRGAMGAVYLVRARDTGERLALKRLFRVDGKTVLRLKREFRLLADVSHPNLAKVYELGRDADGWFLAMEYVEGVDLRSHLQGGAEQDGTLELELTPRPVRATAPLLAAFHQLASGVRALHRCGMLHRDLKPSNVLVSEQRVVVLDFGLARELDPEAASLTEEGAIAGTPAYMAPEQATGQALSEASDWYAFGVMLYEALTGVLPFAGTVYELLRAKLERDPVAPLELDREIPAELSALCMALLARDPAARPHGDAVVTRLEPQRTGSSPQEGVEPAAVEPAAVEPAASPGRAREPVAAAFFGRAAEVAALWQALQDVHERRTVAVHVRGVSGAGKSALVEEFLDRAELERSDGTPGPLVLRSRCYEREAMPFKALDGVIDALGRHLARLDDFTVSHLLPTDIAALAQLFPVLERLRAVQHLLSVLPAPGNAAQDRQRAEAALRELLGRLAARRQLVIWIDDLQWGDLDSARIIVRWLQHATELPMLLVLSYRSDDIETSECLRLLLRRDEPAQATAAVSETLQLQPLAAEEISELVRHVLGAHAHAQDAVVARIVTEAQGSPFLAVQLATLAVAKLARGDRDVAAISIAGLVAQVTALLPAEARHLLAVLAIAGRPMLPKIALRAAGVEHAGRELVHALRRLQLVRSRDVAGDGLLEVYHDRVREGVQRLLRPEQRERIQASLLSVLEYGGRSDPDWLHSLALGAQQRVAALRYGIAAAERATAALAFEHAAELYARCVELSDPNAEHRGPLLRKLAAALGWCGRGAMAAAAYLQAAEHTQGSDAVRLLQLAASHLFRSGRYDEAEAVHARLLAALQLNVPRTTFGLIRAILWNRLRLALRGSRYTPRRENEVPEVQLARFDIFDSLRHDTISLDPLRSALFLAYQLRLAYQTGEPSRVLRALSGLCFMLASTASTRRAQRRVETLLAQVEALAAQVGTPAARATLCALRAMVDWSFGRHEAMLAPAAEAEQLFRQVAPSTLEAVYYMRLVVSASRQGALVDLGRYRAFVAELQASLLEAHATDNRAIQLHMALNETLRDELLDRAQAAVARLEQQRPLLPRGRFGTHHLLHMIAVGHAACATGAYAWGMRHLQEDWPRYQRSAVRGLANLTHVALSMRVRLLLNHQLGTGTGTGEGVERLLRSLRPDLAELERARKTAGGSALLDVLFARIEHAEGNTQRAIARLQRAIARGPEVIEHAFQRQALGCMLGGEQGAELCAASQRALLEAGAVNPDAWLRSYMPELMPARPATR